MKLTAKHYAQAWYSQLQQADSSKWSDISQAVLDLILQRGDLKLLPDITRLVENLYYKEQNLTPVLVTSAQPLSSNAIDSSVEKVLPLSRVAIRTAIDPMLVGGVRVETINQRWDISLRRQLDSLAHSLTH